MTFLEGEPDTGTAAAAAADAQGQDSLDLCPESSFWHGCRFKTLFSPLLFWPGDFCALLSLPFSPQKVRLDLEKDVGIEQDRSLPNKHFFEFA